MRNALKYNIHIVTVPVEAQRSPFALLISRVIMPKIATKKRTVPAAEAPDVYEVESILGDKVVAGVTHYFVKWVGFGMGDNSWIPVDNLDDYARLISEYHQKKSQEAFSRAKSSAGGKAANAGNQLAPARSNANFAATQQNLKLATSANSATANSCWFKFSQQNERIMTWSVKNRLCSYLNPNPESFRDPLEPSKRATNGNGIKGSVGQQLDSKGKNATDEPPVTAQPKKASGSYEVERLIGAVYDKNNGG
ncbi:hypothetical protein BV898_05128 [Hypsibius exemplaris]|uniref:Chromo domain-containing protein n=1 Tax=Hypsibius exemplaris TaxID=2072580 RepID=A0A1W0X0S2_HYPEX|nr:hypothetical protein BV898_05128 [Hypsibius exemplaris]